MTRVLTLSESEPVSDVSKVIKFRLEWLRAAGYSKRNADLIASDLNIDWHFAVDLRKNCDDEQLCMHIIFGTA